MSRQHVNRSSDRTGERRSLAGPESRSRFRALFSLSTREQEQHQHRGRHRRASDYRHKDGSGPDRSGQDHRRPERDVRTEIELRDIDVRHSSFVVAAKLGVRARKLEDCIKRHFEDSGRPISQDTRIRLFARGKELRREDVAERYRVIYYRLTTELEDDSWKITHFQDETKGRLDGPFADELVCAIEAGCTVGQLRRKVAEHSHIEDHNRIIIIAKDGIRPGLLQGDGWEVRQVRDWYCRWLSIDIGRQNGYLALRGHGRQYIFHPIAANLENNFELKQLKQYLEQRLFKNVHHFGRSRLDISWPEITLTSNGNRLGSFLPVTWGATYDFELSIDAAEALAKEESWLLSATEMCTVCADNKKITELPVQITEKCSHSPTVCKDCLGKWIHASMETSTWDRLKCPECPEPLGFPDMYRYADPEDLRRYDDLATRAALKDMRNFHWCLSTKCQSGQIHDADCPKFTCRACRSRQCIRHNMPWHSGETCEQYDKRNRRRMRDEKASEDTIKSTSKKCPECRKDVHKFTGCNHITCICGHEWCYVCLAPFLHNVHGFLYCRHNAGCTEQDPFADLIDPAGRPRFPRHAPPNGRRPFVAMFMEPENPQQQQPAWEPPQNFMDNFDPEDFIAPHFRDEGGTMDQAPLAEETVDNNWHGQRRGGAAAFVGVAAVGMAAAAAAAAHRAAHRDGQHDADMHDNFLRVAEALRRMHDWHV